MARCALMRHSDQNHMLVDEVTAQMQPTLLTTLQQSGNEDLQTHSKIAQHPHVLQIYDLDITENIASAVLFRTHRKCMPEELFLNGYSTYSTRSAQLLEGSRHV